MSLFPKLRFSPQHHNDQMRVQRNGTHQPPNPEPENDYELRWMLVLGIGVGAENPP